LYYNIIGVIKMGAFEEVISFVTSGSIAGLSPIIFMIITFAIGVI